MDKRDYFFGVFFIGFILCLGFMNVNFSSVFDYFVYAVSGEMNFMYQLSWVCVVGMVYFFVQIIKKGKS